MKIDQEVPNYKKGDSVIYYKDKIFVPANKALRLQVLQECHDLPIAGHLGIEKTLKTIQWNFDWPEMRSHVQQYVNSCDIC